MIYLGFFFQINNIVKVAEVKEIIVNNCMINDMMNINKIADMMYVTLFTNESIAMSLNIFTNVFNINENIAMSLNIFTNVFSINESITDTRFTNISLFTAVTFTKIIKVTMIKLFTDMRFTKINNMSLFTDRRYRYTNINVTPLKVFSSNGTII